MIESMKLTGPDGLHPRLALFYAQMEDVRRNLTKLADGLDQAALESRPVKGFMSAGILLSHIAEAEAWWIRVILQGKPDADNPRRLPKGWCAPFAEIEAGDPIAEGQPLEAYLALLEEVRAHTLSALAELKTEVLDRRFEYHGLDGKNYEFTAEWILHHLVEHEAHHRGQLALLKRML